MKVQKVIDELREHVLPIIWEEQLSKFPTVVAIEIWDANKAERAILAKWLKTNLQAESFLNVKGRDLDVGNWFPFIEADATHIVAEWHPYGEDCNIEHCHLISTGVRVQRTLYDFVKMRIGLAPLANEGVVSALEHLAFIPTESIHS